MKTPSGLAEIKTTFGDVTLYIDADGHLNEVAWRAAALAQAHLPFTMALAWKPEVKVSTILCHGLLVPVFESVFQKIADESLQYLVPFYGGCFAYRPQRGSSKKLSTHAWGIAVDLNPVDNQQGTDGHLDKEVVQIFTEAGFEWGGNFSGSRRDPMHFQFATNY